MSDLEMLATSHASQIRHITRALLALSLCYALLVQALAAHQTLLPHSFETQDEICLSDGTSSRSDHDPMGSERPHHTNALCCQIFSAGDLPRFVANITRAQFAAHSALYPPIEFLYRIDTLLADAPSLPRAPPDLG